MEGTSARRRGGAVLGFGWLLVVFLFASPGEAQPAQENEEQKRTIARGYVVAGDEALAQGDLVRALDRYERAERLIPAPTVRLRIGRTLVQQGKLVEARAKLKQAAATDVASDAPDAFFKAVVEAQKELAALEPKIPTVEIVAPAAPGDATLDGAPLPESALRAPIPVNPGTHTITLSCCGAQKASPKEGEHLRLTFAPAARVEAPAAEGGGPDVRFIAGLSALGVGAVSLGVGIYGTAQVLAAERDPEFDRIQSMYTQGTSICDLARNGMLRSPAEAQYALDICGKGETGLLLQLVFYPLAAVTTGVGVFLLATSGKSSQPSAARRIEVSPTAGRGYGGFLVRGSF